MKPLSFQDFQKTAKRILDLSEIEDKIGTWTSSSEGGAIVYADCSFLEVTENGIMITVGNFSHITTDLDRAERLLFSRHFLSEDASWRETFSSAALKEDLDEAFTMIMDPLGIKDGGFADMHISEEIANHHSDNQDPYQFWKSLSQSDREEFMETFASKSVLCGYLD